MSDQNIPEGGQQVPGIPGPSSVGDGSQSVTSTPAFPGVQPVAPLASGTATQAVTPSALSTRVPSTVVFAIGLLVFLLPFLEVRCNSVPFVKVSGLKLATGFDLEQPGMGGSSWNLGETVQSKPANRNEGNTYAIAALILSGASLGLAFSQRKSGVTGALITGILAGIALIGLMIDIKNQVTGKLSAGDGVVISVDFTPWFYISVLAAFAGAFLCLKRLPFLKA